MKKSIGIGLLFLAVIILGGCKTSGVVLEGEDKESEVSAKTGEDYDQVIEVRNPLRLSDFLDRAPGVRMSGNTVSIRGNPPPLFILDGIWMGHSFSRVESIVNVHDVQSVEVLKNPGEIAMYGVEGRYGVIIIRTR
jgi:hypothetical protein